MVEDVRICAEDGVDGVVRIIEIRGKHFDGCGGIEGADSFNGLAEMLGAAIGEIVSGNSGDDDVFEFKAASGFGDAGGFIGFESERASGGDGAEVAGAGATIAGNHEGGGAFAPALPMIGTTGALTDGVEVQFIEERPGAGKA